MDTTSPSRMSTSAFASSAPAPSSTVQQGVVWLPDEAIVRPQAEGFVAQILVRDGDQVAAGTLLLRLPPLRAGVRCIWRGADPRPAPDRRSVRVKCLLAGVLCLAAVGATAQNVPVPPFASKPELARLDYDLKPRQIAPGTWVIEGEVADFTRANGCNIINTGFIVTGAGVVVVNTGPSRLYGEQLRALVGAVDGILQAQAKAEDLDARPDASGGGS